MAVIGIDLGTTYCAAYRYLNEVHEPIPLDGNPTFPSVASVLKNGTIAVGKKAKNNQAKCPQDTVVEVKRLMGVKDKTVKLGKETYTPQQISAMFLKEIKRLAEEELAEEVTGAVITCPAYFKDPQRNAIKEAGQLAGLNVLKIVNEPTAAAYAYCVEKKELDKENLFLVYDLGGGTFDVTVISMIAGHLNVIGTGGDSNLGGGDFDDKIVEWMLEKIKETQPEYFATLDEEKKMPVMKIRLKSEAEKAKIALCAGPLEEYHFKLASIDRFEGGPVRFNESLTMVEFEARIMKLVENSFKWIETAMEVPRSKKYNYTDDSITGILLVGGSTRVPLIRKMLQERFPGKQLCDTKDGINPDVIVAMGAAILASEYDPDNDQVSNTSMKDVTGHTLSVETMSDEKGKLVLTPIIPKETPIPVEAAHRFQSLGKGQSQVKIKVCQGEGEDPESPDVMMIGEYLVEIDPINDPTPLLIGLNIDLNGLLVAHATNLNNGNKISCKINYKDSTQMPADEIERKQAELAATMNAQVGTTPNPLDEMGDNGGPSNVNTTASNLGGSGSGEMNPIVKALYDKAIKNFLDIPEKNKMEVMQIVAEMDKAAKAGDQSKLMELYAPLSQLIGKL